MPLFNRRRGLALILALLFAIAIIHYLSSSSTTFSRIPPYPSTEAPSSSKQQSSSSPPKGNASSSSSSSSPSGISSFRLGDYSSIFPPSTLTPHCRKHFSSSYLTSFSSSSSPGFEYCTFSSPSDDSSSSSSSSSSSMRCFHTPKGPQAGKPDSFCLSRNVHLDPKLGRFQVNCSIRELTESEKEKGGLRFQSIRGYWYNTGAPAIFRDAIDIHPSDSLSNHEKAATDKTVTLSPITTGPLAGDPALVNNRTYILLRREGEGNLWHCMQEFFSLFLTLDALHISPDPSSTESSSSLLPSLSNTQLVILDGRPDGPYFDLWSAISSLPPIRMRDLLSAAQAPGAPEISSASLIIPLAGAASNFWNDKPQTRKCTHSELLDTFVRRVLSHYGLPTDDALAEAMASDAAVEAEMNAPKPIVVTIIDRKEHRKLKNQDKLMAALREEFGHHVEVAAVDFASISFREQLALVRQTDILVGVHGAGLAHGMFMRPDIGAVVEIMPDDMNLYIFRDPAKMRGLGYYRTHAKSMEKSNASPDDDWHHRDIVIETERFVEIVGAAVRQLFSSGLRSWDVSRIEVN